MLKERLRFDFGISEIRLHIWTLPMHQTMSLKTSEKPQKTCLRIAYITSDVRALYFQISSTLQGAVPYPLRRVDGNAGVKHA